MPYIFLYGVLSCPCKFKPSLLANHYFLYVCLSQVHGVAALNCYYLHSADGKLQVRGFGLHLLRKFAKTSWNLGTEDRIPQNMRSENNVYLSGALFTLSFNIPQSQSEYHQEPQAFKVFNSLT